jgi:mannose-6-phosphate isomerase-like protein (cupin superfamily)
MSAWRDEHVSALGVDHAISNTGLVDLVFLVVTSPVTDETQ